MMKLNYDLESSFKLAAIINLYVFLASSNLVDCFNQSQMKHLGSLCNELKTIKKLSEMDQLIKVLKEVMKDVDYIEYQKYSHWNEYWKQTFDHSRPCLAQADAIVNLNPIIIERENVCKSNHITKIEAYYEKYLKNKLTTHCNQPKPITSDFFFLYAGQVAIICKQNLLKSLNLADEKLFNDDSYAKVMPWQSNQENICKTIDLNHNAISPTNKKPSNQREETQRLCSARQALSGAKNVYELVESIDRDEQTMIRMVTGFEDDSKAADSLNNINLEDSNETEYILVVPEHDKQTIEEILKTCLKFKPVYENTVLSIVRLISMGIDPDFKKFNRRFDLKCQQEKLIQQWFSITLICNSMLKSRLADDANDVDGGNDISKLDGQHGFIIVEEERHQDEENNSFLEEPLSFLSYPIEDELWIGKFLPSRIGRLKTKFIKNIVKTFKINQLLNNVVFQKTIKRVKRVTISLILVVLTLMGINGALFLKA